LGRHSRPDTGGVADEPADETFAGDPGTGYPAFPAALVRRVRQRYLGDWRGGHRSEGGRRGVSVGVIASLTAVVVVVGSIIAWSFFGDVLSDRSHRAAGQCMGGQEPVAVVADPTISDVLKQLADGFNASADPVGDHCMMVGVTQAGANAVLGGLTGTWPSELGGQPALWIPGSSVSAARLAAAGQPIGQPPGQKVITDSRSLVTSPVLLATRPDLAHALANQSWAALPGLQANPNALAGVNLPTWGSLRLALPAVGDGDASLLAGEAVAAASVPAGAPATLGVGSVRALVGAQPKLADNSSAAAMNALLNSGDAASAPVHAVITTEQQLFQRGRTLSEGALASWMPPGPVPVADYPTVLLSGPWLTTEQTSAASEFARFLHKPDQLATLAKSGFRVKGVESPRSPVTTFPALPATLSVGDDSVRVTLAEALATQSGGGAATIMLDQSMPIAEGGKPRLSNVIAALTDKIKALPPTAVVGLWTFDGREGRAEVATGPLSDPVNGQPRGAALSAALDRQYPSGGGAVSFTTLRMIYQDTQARYVAGRTNTILLITSGPHTDQSLDGPGLQDFFRKGADPAKPIAVNVIDFGDDPDRATWQAVAQISGGGYQNLATSASPELAAAINAYLY